MLCEFDGIASLRARSVVIGRVDVEEAIRAIHEADEVESIALIDHDLRESLMDRLQFSLPIFPIAGAVSEGLLSRAVHATEIDITHSKATSRASGSSHLDAHKRPHEKVLGSCYGVGRTVFPSLHPFGVSVWGPFEFLSELLSLRFVFHDSKEVDEVSVQIIEHFSA